MQSISMVIDFKKLFTLQMLFSICGLVFSTHIYAQTDTTKKKSIVQEILTDTMASKSTLKDTLPTRSVVDEGQMKGYFLIKTEKTRLDIGGFIQADFMHDFKQIGNRDGMSPYSIPIPNIQADRTTFSIRQSRITVKSATITNTGVIKTLMEVDFVGPNGTTGLRVRHAWGEIGRLGVGLYWSNFMNIDVIPNTLDLATPNSLVIRRTVQARYTTKIKNFTIRLSLENPISDIQSADSLKMNPVENSPNIVGTVRYVIKDGVKSMQLSFIYHPIAYEFDTDKQPGLHGYGVNFSGIFRTPLQTNIQYQYAYGKGIAQYISDMGGYGLDAVLVPGLNKYTMLPVHAAMLFGEHFWKAKFSTMAGVGYVNLTKKDFQPPETFHSSWYTAVNSIYYPSTSVKMGVEFLYGKRQNVDGNTGDNLRIQGSVFFRF